MSFVDLHIHSHHSSDGEWSVERIWREAEKHGMEAFSISDHDTVAGVEEAEGMREDFSCRLISNVEISTGYGGHKFHLLAPLVDWRSSSLRDFLSRIRQARLRQNRQRVERLRQLGFDLSLKEVEEAMEGRPVTGPAVASALLKKPQSRRDPRLRDYFERDGQSGEVAFYKDYFLPGRPAHTPREEAALEDAIGLVRRNQGVAVLAHPGLKPGTVDEEMLTELKEMGLQGLEVFTSYHDESASARYLDLARKLDLTITAGSDFHGKVKPGVAFGSVREGDLNMVEALEKRRQGN
ncbi:MAG TPA: PHP domain-containing protein [Acidobacteriota bacterium]|nr:PHP domain-containing protein [Acidobacteriota bacterium]